MSAPIPITIHQPEASVARRYAAAAEALEPSLCCPVEYSAELLAVIPDEVIERDYGCGDPTPYVRQGETVLDLGSGGGKLCFIAAQVVGPSGRVIGVDCNRPMLDLARKHAPTVAQRLGFENVAFRYGLIQDLRLDLELLGNELARQPVTDPASYLTLRNVEEQLRLQQPMIGDDSVDCVLSNCVLNLVRQQDRTQLFREIFRVLRPGGRAAISDIVSDKSVPEALQQDPTLWSGCLSGAFREDEFCQAFEEAGFHGIEIVKRQRQPWQTVAGIEFRSMTIVAHKAAQAAAEGPSAEPTCTMVYRGPFKTVEDDDGNRFMRGRRIAVSGNTAQLLQREPYRGLFEAVGSDPSLPLAIAQRSGCCNDERQPSSAMKVSEEKAADDPAQRCCGTDKLC